MLLWIVDTILHRNFIEYLTVAYENHFSVVVSPDVIFYTLLCEISEAVKAKPDFYKSILASFLNEGGEKPALVSISVYNIINKITCAIINQSILLFRETQLLLILISSWRAFFFILLWSNNSSFVFPRIIPFHFLSFSFFILY